MLRHLLIFYSRVSSKDRRTLLWNWDKTTLEGPWSTAHTSHSDWECFDENRSTLHLFWTTLSFDLRQASYEIWRDRLRPRTPKSLSSNEVSNSCLTLLFFAKFLVCWSSLDEIQDHMNQIKVVNFDVLSKINFQKLQSQNALECRNSQVVNKKQPHLGWYLQIRVIPLYSRRKWDIF